MSLFPRSTGGSLTAIFLGASLLGCPPAPEPESTPDAARPDPVAPVVEVSADRTSGQVPLTVTFEATVTLDERAAARTYVWEFGDGTRSIEASPIRIFEDAGTFNVSCTVTDSNDLEGSDSIDVEATARPPAEYVGSDRCAACHLAEATAWAESGHAHALTPVAGAAPSFPFSTVAEPPAGAAWEDISYVVGGFGWRALFLDAEGRLITGPEAQFNVEPQALARYESDTVGSQDFDCGRCHTTGWVASADNGGAHQDDLPGILGTWEENGIGCEACHGPGGIHVEDTRPITIDRANRDEVCARCHSRGEERVFVVDGLLLNYQQADEHLLNHHGGDHITCNGCHDPHLTAVHNSQTADEAIHTDCSYCHPGRNSVINGPMAALACTDCHMPDAALSAVATGTGVHLRGDLKSHAFAIDQTGRTLDEQLETDGEVSWLSFDEIGEVAVNIAWACMQCHDGESAPEITDHAVALERALTVHGEL